MSGDSEVRHLEAQIEKRRKRVSRAFIIQIIANFVVLSYIGYQVGQNHSFLSKLKKTDVAICIRTNQLLTDLIMPGLKQLNSTAYYKNHPDEKKITRQQLKKALAKANPKKCQNLPSQK